MRIQLIAAMLLSSVVAMAQSVKRPDTYNYNRGVEAIQNNNGEEALEYLAKEIKENPNNGYAYAWIAAVKQHDEEYGSALSSINTAIKKIPAKDKEYKAWSYSVRCDVYLSLEDTISAMKDVTTAISLQPERSGYYEKRAQILYEQKKYDEANKDYDKMIALDEGGVMGYMGKGRNFNAQKRYEEAIPLFDYVTKLHKDYASGYSFRADSYFGLKRYDKALDDVIAALAINADNKAFYIMQNLSDSAFVETVAKFKIRKRKEPNEDYWDYCLGVIHEQHKAYGKAIDFYKSSMKKNASDVTANRIADCYDEMGDYSHAIEYIDIAIQMDSTDYRYPMAKANILDNKGDSKAAIRIFDSLIEKYPDYGFAYYRRGWIKEHSKDADGALEDYTMSISLSPNYAYAYLNRGRIYKVMGDIEKANADFKKCIEIDEKEDDGDKCSYYGYFYLGDNDKAIEILNKSLKVETKSNCYEATCVYSLMGNTDKANDYLEKALKLGYNDFTHIRRDTDLDNIRNTERFKTLISEYEARLKKMIEEESEDDNASYEEKVVEVPFTKEGGVCRVKCTINGLPLHFIFDTGASDVSISNVEATFMVKNDYLQKSDFGGSQYYLTANGDVSEGTSINLRSITFGGLTLENVKASVVKAQSAPLLLGQSVLGRLGKIEIDNEKRVLRITHKEKK